MLDHHWRADDGRLIVLFGSSLPSSTKNNKKKQTWTPSGSAYVINHKTNYLGIIPVYYTCAVSRSELSNFTVVGGSGSFNHKQKVKNITMSVTQYIRVTMVTETNSFQTKNGDESASLSNQPIKNQQYCKHLVSKILIFPSIVIVYKIIQGYI